jgi:hypothetical protein
MRIIKDMNVVMKRIAENIVKYTSVHLIADTGLITEENVMTSRFRYPRNEYNRIDRAFTSHFQAVTEFDDFDEKAIITIVRLPGCTDARFHDINDEGIIHLKRIC